MHYSSVSNFELFLSLSVLNTSCWYSKYLLVHLFVINSRSTDGGSRYSFPFSLSNFIGNHERSRHHLHGDHIRSRKHREMVILRQEQGLPHHETALVRRHRSHSQPHSAPHNPSLVHPQRFTWRRADTNPKVSARQIPDR